MSSKKIPWFKRHPGWTLLLVNGAILLFFALIAEIGLRIGAQYNPGYYTSVDVTDTDLNYAYGTIKINSDGYPDEEFELISPLRVGYFGDSVTYGVGAGYGYRVSEYLEEAYPEYEHLNLGGIGLSVSEIDEFQLALAFLLYGLFGHHIDEPLFGSGNEPKATTLQHHLREGLEVVCCPLRALRLDHLERAVGRGRTAEDLLGEMMAIHHEDLCVPSGEGTLPRNT